MRLARSKDGGWEWHLTRPEWSLLAAIGSLFPLVPPEHHRAVREGPATDAPLDPVLLRESLAAHKADLRAAVRDWIQQAASRSTRGGLVLRLTAMDLDRWLQVLNDIRVGSWIRLGCPDQSALRALEQNPANERNLFLMEFCGMVQGRFLQALDEPHDTATD